MGAEKNRAAERKAKHAAKVQARPDPVADVLEVVLDFIADHRAEHPSDPPPVFTLSPFRESWSAVVSDKAYRRSVSGWGGTPGDALSNLETRLCGDEVPWKLWEGPGK